MKKVSTLPVIKEKETLQSSAVKSKQTFRKLEDKVNIQDDEILKNQKMISSLASQFRLLKEQLQFEQQYSEKYKNTVGKYQEESTRQAKIIKEQKTSILKLEGILADKQRSLQFLSSENKKIQQSLNESLRQNEQLIKLLKKKDSALKVEQSQKEKLRRELKEKARLFKQRKSLQNQQNIQLLQSKEAQIARMERQIGFLSTCLEHEKDQAQKGEEVAEQLRLTIFKLEEEVKIEKQTKHKVKALEEENRLLQLTNQHLQQKISSFDSQKLEREKNMEAGQDRLNQIIGDQQKQFNIEKKDLKAKIQNFQKEIESMLKKGKTENVALERERQLLELQRKKCENLQRKGVQLEKFKTKMLNSGESIQGKLKNIKQTITCEHCKKALKSPVTNIPCGHSYCLQCKKGYQKQCSKCPGVKREAVYRNELLDEIIEASQVIEVILQHLHS